MARPGSRPLSTDEVPPVPQALVKVEQVSADPAGMKHMFVNPIEAVLQQRFAYHVYTDTRIFAALRG